MTLDRVIQALEHLDLTPDAEGLVDFINQNWKEIDHHTKGEEDEQKRQTFSQILERALAAELEGNTDEIKKAALESK